ncbi:MAG: D-alanine--D-alanine ligase [Alphaproteobacteria bacterium]
MTTRKAHNPKETKVALLMGGWNTEREVSLSSGKAMLESLQRQGYQVKALDLTHNLEELLHFLTPKPDIVFNGLHGMYVEDGRLQGILDILEIPYTHSGARASAIAMHKPTAKVFFELAGIPCAKGGVFNWDDIQDRHPMHTPYVIKPLDEGSSVGVHIIHEEDGPINNRLSWSFQKEVLVEEYIPGYELSCVVMGDKSLGVIELRAKQGFYDYRAKYTDGVTDHIFPAPVPKPVYDNIMDYALKAHKIIGCAGVSRSDFRYDPKTGRVCILEINTQPGCTTLSIVPDVASHVGISFDKLVSWLIEDGLCQGLRR